MVKYNYTGAAALWTEYCNICCEPWQLSRDEWQKERRQFMRAVTRHIDIKLYIDYIYELIDEARPVETAKSRCYDFKYENDLENLIWKIKTFYKNGVIK